MSDEKDPLEEARSAYEAGDLEAAKRLCDKRLAKAKDDAAAKCLLGEIQLSLGKLPAGLANYEARWELPEFAEFRRSRFEPWWDGSPLGTKTLMLGLEGGLEEVLQFCRYAPVLLRRFPQAQVILEVPKTAQELISRSFSRVDRVSVVGAAGPDGEGLPSFDCYLPLVSAPGRAQTIESNIPSTKAYLFAKKPRRLAPEKEMAIGISWRSHHPTGGKRWSLPLAKLARSLQHPGTRLINLQEGDTEAECRHLIRTDGIAVQNPRGVPEGTWLGPWSDVVAGCDLVVTADNAVAHMAGALGKETWVLLAHPPHWRWFMERDDSPWYPSVKLFRQPLAGDWELMLPDVMAAVSERLNKDEAA